MPLHVSSTVVLIIRSLKLHYTASGIITPIGGRLVQPVQETATYRCDDATECVMQFWPRDDEHMCSKHVEAWNKLIVKQKFYASSWLISEINKPNTVASFSTIIKFDSLYYHTVFLSHSIHLQLQLNTHKCNYNGTVIY